VREQRSSRDSYGQNGQKRFPSLANLSGEAKSERNKQEDVEETIQDHGGLPRTLEKEWRPGGEKVPIEDKPEGVEGQEKDSGSGENEDSAGPAASTGGILRIRLWTRRHPLGVRL